MAQIEGGGDSGHKKGPGVKKAKKLSTRVDMTPMVDLGFLLITFFIFTTTMSSPKAMNLNMPKDTKNQEELNKAKESGALTIMLGKDNSVFYYMGVSIAIVLLAQPYLMRLSRMIYLYLYVGFGHSRRVIIEEHEPANK